jgi:hypothetical protein
LSSLGVMGESNEPWLDEPSGWRHGLVRDPFWLEGAAQPETEPAFERLAHLTDQAAAAAREAADEIRAELERSTASEKADDQHAEAAQLLHSARERLTRFEREASGLARLLREARALEPPRAAASQESEAESHDSEAVSAGTRVLVRQMAADGCSPEEIEARLAEEFGVSDARAVVEQTLRSK